MTVIPRVLLTKSFIDSHDRAIKTIAIALREGYIQPPGSDGTAA